MTTKPELLPDRFTPSEDRRDAPADVDGRGVA